MRWMAQVKLAMVEWRASSVTPVGPNTPSSLRSSAASAGWGGCVSEERMWKLGCAGSKVRADHSTKADKDWRKKKNNKIYPFFICPLVMKYIYIASWAVMTVLLQSLKLSNIKNNAQWLPQAYHGELGSHILCTMVTKVARMLELKLKVFKKNLGKRKW